jgi:SAM-dependent methyltransferase
MDAKAIYESKKEFAGTAQGLLMPDEVTYHRRLVKGVELVKSLNPLSVLDVGCGYGDLGMMLPQGCIYLGIDMTEWIVEEAKKRHPKLDFQMMTLQQMDLDRPFDVVVCLGILATTPKDEWNFVLHKLKALASRAVVVSWLDAFKYKGKLVSAIPSDILHFGDVIPSRIDEIADDETLTAILPVSSHV